MIAAYVPRLFDGEWVQMMKRPTAEWLMICTNHGNMTASDTNSMDLHYSVCRSCLVTSTVANTHIIGISDYFSAISFFVRAGCWRATLRVTACFRFFSVLILCHSMSICFRDLQCQVGTALTLTTWAILILLQLHSLFSYRCNLCWGSWWSVAFLFGAPISPCQQCLQDLEHPPFEVFNILHSNMT